MVIKKAPQWDWQIKKYGKITGDLTKTNKTTKIWTGGRVGKNVSIYKDRNNKSWVKYNTVWWPPSKLTWAKQ